MTEVMERKEALWKSELDWNVSQYLLSKMLEFGADCQSQILCSTSVSVRLGASDWPSLPANLKLPTLWRVQLQSPSLFTKLSRKCCGLGFGIGLVLWSSFSSPIFFLLFSRSLSFASFMSDIQQLPPPSLSPYASPFPAPVPSHCSLLEAL